MDGKSKIIVPQGSGSLNMSITIVTNPPLPIADNYNIVVMIRPVGSTAGDAIDEDSRTINIIAPSITNEIPPIHDAYLQGSTLFNTQDLRVEGGNRVSYLQFDLSDVSGEIQSMQIELTVGSDAGNGNVKIINGSHSEWTELNLSSINSPLLENELDQKAGPFDIGQTYSFNVSDAVIIDNKISLIVTMDNGGNDVSFASKENTNSVAPNLIVKTTLVTSIDQVNKNRTGIYPNPTSDILNLVSPEEWTITSILGEVVLTGTEQTVNISNLTNGMYIVTQNGTTYRLIKK